VRSRWYRTPRNAQTEQDFRTKSGLTLIASPANPILGNPTTLTANLSVANATVTDYTWTLDIDDPTRLPIADRASFSTGTTDNTSYIYPTIGTYTAQVEVSYTIGGVAQTPLTATATIVVGVDPASLGATLTTDSPTISGQITTLTAQPEGLEPQGYIWDFGDGSAPLIVSTAPIPSPDIQEHTYPTAVGIYTPTVTICYDSADPCNESRSAEAQVEIIDEALAGLTASYTPVQTTYLVGEVIQFDASVTAGTNPVYTWDFGNGTERNGDSLSYGYPEPGTYDVTVTVRNSIGELSTTLGPITVVEQGIVGPIVADNDSPTFFGETTTLSATVSEGTNVYYMWDFGDGEQAVTRNNLIQHIYPTIGTFTATVTVSNSVTAETVIPAAETTVTIEDRAIEGLSAINDSPTLLGNTTTFTASVTAGTNVEYQWDFTDGTVTDWTSSPTTTHTFAGAGTYIVTVRARNSATQEAFFTTTDAIIVGPDLAITKTASAPEVEAGELVTFTLTVENSGSYTATSLIISDQLPNGATFVSAPFADGSGDGQLANGIVTWTADELGPNASITVLLVVTGESSLINDTYSVRTEDQFGQNVAGSPSVSVIVNADSIIFLPIITTAAPSDLPDLIGSFTLSPNKTTFSADELVTISGRVTNQGTAPSTDAFWVDLFINPTTPPTPGEVPTIWNLRCEQPCIGISWAITRTLQPGESITFNSTADSYHDEYTIWEGYFDTNPTNLYLYVDPWAAEGTPNREQGAVVELLEDNNRTDLENLTVQGLTPGLLSAPDRWLPPRPNLTIPNRQP
jgi:uncharacterized repeat protein (TIGR01451 family)